MDAHELLQIISDRGGVIRLKIDASGSTKINVTPRSVAFDFLPELRQLKPQLIQLLNHNDYHVPSLDKNSQRHARHEVEAAVEAIMRARRGAFLCYGSPVFAEAWRWVNAVTGRSLISRELMAWAQENEVSKDVSFHQQP